MQRRTSLRAVLAAAFVALVAAAPASGQVVISEVYGGGGNSGATLTHDFIELFNRGSTAVDLSTWSLQYGAATGNIGPTSTPTQITPLSGSIEPGQWVLVREAQGTGGSVGLTADITDDTPIAMAAGAG